MLTRRGYLVTAAGVVAAAMAWEFGPRSLNAVFAPVLVALVAAFVQARRIDPPEVTRRFPDHGTAGETVPVTLSLAAPTPFDATVTDAVSDGLTPEGNRAETTVAETDVTYRVRLDRRGQHRLGPVRVTARDVLGLWETELECEVTDTLLALPRVHDLHGPVRRHVERLHQRSDRGRDEFDQLREYVHGDSLQDVHWRTSAKRPGDDLLVREYETPVESRTVTVAAEADEEHVDEMAEAAASVVASLLSMELSVSLVTPDGTVPHGHGDRHLNEVLTALARTDAGSVDPSVAAAADVTVTGRGADGVQVTVGTFRRSFAELVGTADGSERNPSDSPVPSDDGETATSARADGGRGGSR